MSFKIVAIADLHYGCVSHPGRQGKFSHVFALRTVHRLNETIKPGAVLLMGDLIDDPAADDATARLTELKAIFDLLQCPTIAIPGNHDPVPDHFYDVFERPESIVDIGPVRFSSFLDPEEPEWNACRMQPELDRMASIRDDGFSGPVVALQHATAVPPGTTDCCFNYVNMDEVMAGMQAGQVTLTVGGHYHPGTALVREQDSAYLGVPAMCEAPFKFTEIDLPLDRDVEKIKITTHQLQVPAELGLYDLHSHTQFAYCSENVDTTLSPEFAGIIGLAGLAFTEHSGQLNFDQKAYWSGEFCKQGLATTRGAQYRAADYWTSALQAQKKSPVNLLVGFEVDSDFSGAQVLRAPARRATAWLATRSARTGDSRDPIVRAGNQNHPNQSFAPRGGQRQRSALPQP
jgi:hypothetical protein